MPNCFSCLRRSGCCQEQLEPTYIYLYSPRTGSSSSMSPSLYRCLICLILGFCLTFILILTGLVIYHLNSNAFLLKATTNQQVIPIARRRQLPSFVNLNKDPCENFYEFVCDKWIQAKKSEIYENEYERKRARIRHRIHDTLMANITSLARTSSESYSISSRVSLHKFYQLCEKQSPSLLIDEFDRYFASLKQQEPFRSHLTIFNRTNQTNSTSHIVTLSNNPFFQISSSPYNSNQTFSTITRIRPRPLVSPLLIFPDLDILNQTALTDLIKFNNDYTKFLQQVDDIIRSYEPEYSQDSLIIRRILFYSNYHQCLSSLNQGNGLQNLIELLNHFLQHRLGQYNIRLMDKQIRALEKLTDNRTLVEQLNRIRFEFKTIEQIVPLQNGMLDRNASCITNLLDQLLDRRFQLNELPSTIRLYLPNDTEEYFISNDWPYVMLFYDRLLKELPVDTLVNFVFFDYYRQLIYPYYQPHIQHATEFVESSPPSCHVESCFDIFNCYHPSLLNQIINADRQISIEIINITVHQIINRFRLLIEQSDNLFSTEKRLLINELDQMKIFIGHFPPPSSSSLLPISNLQSSSYLEYVQLFSSFSYDQQIKSYSIEPIYSSENHTLFLPYGFLYLTNNSIEYSLMKFLLKILSQTIESNPFYIECLIKSFDDSNSTTSTTTSLNYTDEHIAYLLFRSKFLSEKSIILDEYLWAFMSANVLMKQFLINYAAENYCPNANALQLFRNNTFLIDDVHLVFYCQQASSIRQSKCTVN